MQTAGALSKSGERLPARCEIWGVLNVTADSFSDGGRYLTRDAALAHAHRLAAEGADVLDVGGASSRPRGTLYGAGAPQISQAEEIARVVPVIQAAVRELQLRVSIDTTSPEVARASLAAGACIVNDVSGAASDELLDIVAEHGAEYVLMHTRGQGEVVPANTQYADVVAEVVATLLSGAERARAHGIGHDRLWIDPGLGFAKTTSQSLALLAQTKALVATGLRVLVGASRKGFIGELGVRPTGERPAPIEREPGSLAAVTVAVLQGAHAVRVHDVAATRQALQVADAVRRQGPGC